MQLIICVKIYQRPKKIEFKSMHLLMQIWQANLLHIVPRLGSSCMLTWFQYHMKLNIPVLNPTKLIES